MKLFGINFGSAKPTPPRITPPDQQWVEAGFQWLLKVYGYPRVGQRLINEHHFPQTFAFPDVKVENLIADCCAHLGLDKECFSYEVYEDLRDMQNIPYAFAGQPIDCLLRVDEQPGRYTLELAKSILAYPNWLIAAVCYEFAKAKLIHSKAGFDTCLDDKQFVYLAAVYFGYGAVIGQNLTNVGRSSDGLWEKNWAYISAIPYPVMTYALAIFAKLKNDLQPEWREVLPGELKKEFDSAIASLRDADGELFDKRRIENEFTAHSLYKLAFQQYKGGEIDSAVASLQKMLFLTPDASLRAHALHNMGYYKTRLGDYPGSIAALRSCLELWPSYQYGNDNLGFALIMNGDLEAGKLHLDKALESKKNNEAYSFRNLALYYQRKQEFTLAEVYFQKSFAANTPVDLLDFFYGQYLLETGHKTEGLAHIRTAANLGEHEAVRLLQELEGRAD